MHAQSLSSASASASADSAQDEFSFSTASADEVMPVLIFVIIKANPKWLLSNIQFVNTFLGESRMRGAHLYWWTQFVAAVEFIKTMDYP